MDTTVPSAHLQSSEAQPVPSRTAEGSGIHGEVVTINESEQNSSSENVAVPKVHFHVSVDTSNISQSTPSPTLEDKRKTRHPNGRPWIGMFLRLGPLSGIACLVLVVISMLISFGVLLGSNGVAVVAWGVQPSAILAICTAVANQAMRYAAFQGFMVAWWSGGLKPSAHRMWN